VDAGLHYSAGIAEGFLVRVEVFENGERLMLQIVGPDLLGQEG